MANSQDPKGIPTLVPVPPFGPDLLPGALRPWAVDIAERMQCPLDYVAAAVMIDLAAVVGRQVGIRPKQRDDWQVVPNLWGLLIGRPGVMKSPPMKEATRPLMRLEIRAKERHEEAVREYQAGALVAEARRKMAQRDIERAVKKRDGDPDAIAGDVMAEAEPPPVRRRFVVNDPTPEKLQVIMAENPNGVLILRDEAQGLLRSLDKPGREDARAFYIECWAGDGRFTVDRIGRGTLDVPACCASIVATIQPGPLRAYLWDAVSGGKGDDGLMPRFQLAVWPDVPGTWRNVDRWPNTPARQSAFDIIESLGDLDALAIGADTDDHNPVPFLRFDPGAQVVFDEWRGDLERALRTGTLSPALESVLAKYRSLIPSIALLIHLADGGGGPVPASSLDKAIGWGRYLFGHARRVYSTAAGDDRSKLALIATIRHFRGRVTPHDLRHRGFKGDSEAAEKALQGLVAEGLGVWENLPPTRRGGRPTRVFVLGESDPKTETPSNPGEAVGFGFGADQLRADLNSLLQEDAEGEREAGSW